MVLIFNLKNSMQSRIILLFCNDVLLVQAFCVLRKVFAIRGVFRGSYAWTLFGSTTKFILVLNVKNMITF